MREIVLVKGRLDKQGGAEKYTQRLCQAFLKQQCAVTLLTSGRPTLPPQDNLTIHTHSCKKWLSVSNVRSFDRFCLKHLHDLKKKDVVFSLDRNSEQTHLRASNGCHAAYLHHRASVDSYLKALSFRLNPLHRSILALERAAFTHPELQQLIVNSHLVEKEVLSYYNVDQEKVRVIHNGVEWSEKEATFSRWREEKETTCDKLGLSKDSFHFLFLGHNYKRKGLEPLLKGLSLTQDNDVHLSVVGKDKNETYFHKLATSLNLEKRVHFWGAQPDPFPFYQLADSLVIPSFYDPFANVTVEALAMGVFVVSSKTNGGHEVLTPQSGCTIDSLSSPQSVAEALKTALKHKKTQESAQTTRNSVKHLDFSEQLSQITQCVLS